MSSWYTRTVEPRLIDSAMGSVWFERMRPSVIHRARGVVLEIGVGAGHNLPLYREVERVYALEPSQELLAIAQGKKAAVPVRYISASAEYIPLPEHSVDTVISTWTLCSIGDPKRALLEIKRVLRPQGHLLFAEHGASPNHIVRALQHIVTKATKRMRGNCHLDRDIDNLIKEAGFVTTNLTHPVHPLKILMHGYVGSAHPKD